MGRALNDTQVAAYERDGFLAPVDIFTEAEAARFRHELERAEAAWPEDFAGAGRNNAHLIHSCLDGIVHAPALLDAVEDLIGGDILVYGTVLFIKEPQRPGFVSWHQDNRYTGLAPENGVTAWVALSPSTPETGCMRMIPGTHRGETRDHVDTFAEDNILTRGQNIEHVDEAAAVDLVLRPGQVSFHHLRTIHGSRRNLGRDRRIGFAIQAYLPTHVRQDGVENYCQLARGADPHGHFRRAPRPTRDRAPEDVALRNEINGIWSDVLYRGAEKRRAL